MEQTTNLNFICSGRLGDFIHSLFVVKNLSKVIGKPSKLFISDGFGGDLWKFGIEEAYYGLHSIIKYQTYIDSFEIFTEQNHLNLPLINLNQHRQSPYLYSSCWTELLSLSFKFSFPEYDFDNYKWLSTSNKIQDFESKVVVHRSNKAERHNSNFNWNIIYENWKDSLVFVGEEDEYNSFPIKIDYYKPTNLSEQITIINSCKLFIGNQSAPFAIASALDKPRFVELSNAENMFYMGEERYSKNISWYFNDAFKYGYGKLL
jgi:hypothetical protein